MEAEKIATNQIPSKTIYHANKSTQMKFFFNASIN